jgi:hypothetical protein
MKRNFARIAKIVSETLAADFRKAKIIDVRVREDRDFDGAEILRVDVLFEGSPADLDAGKLSGAVRNVRPRLVSEAGETAFPLFSFISKSDLGAERFEPA